MVQQLDHRLLHHLVLQGGDRNRAFFPLLLRDVDAAQGLRSILPLPKPRVQSLHVRLPVSGVSRVRDSVHPGTGFFPQTPKRLIQKTRREVMSDREKLPLLILPG